MVLLQEILFYVGILIYLAVFSHSEVQPDLGPAEPSFETCETMMCPPNSKCMDGDGHVYCLCSPGKSGINCTLDDPCLERKTNCPAGSTCFGDCEPNIICEGAIGIPHCRGCVAGWTGMQCETDIDECAGAVGPCLNHGSCQNIHGDFHCTCKDGWKGKTCDCAIGTTCDVGEIKTGESKDGKGSQLMCSITVLFLSFGLIVIFSY